MSDDLPKEAEEFFRDLPEEVREFFRRQGELGGKLSGAARMEKLTAKQRKLIAQKAGQASAAARRKKKEETDA